MSPPLETLWQILIASFIGLITLVIGWIKVQLQAQTNRLKSNMQRTLSLDERLQAVEQAEAECLKKNRELREQNVDQEMRLRSQKYELDRQQLDLQQLQQQVAALRKESEGKR